MYGKAMAVLVAAVVLGGCGSDGGSGASAEPKLETDPALLDAALECTPFSNVDKPPVLLVHGTFTHGQEQFNWNYKPLLIERGFDVCTVTYPDRGLGDQQISAEYIVHALRRIRAESGRKVAMIGHSQGALMPRWAIRWWPSARDAVEDFVLLAGPNHGTVVAFTDNPLSDLAGNLLGLPAAFYQFARGSQFIAALNAGDETPGDIDYTNVYTLFDDELVQPATPEPTAALEFGQDNPKVANILLQDLCPLLIADHLTIGLTDRATFELALDAITHPGPADVERAGGAALCNALPPLPAPGLNLVREEPPLKPYAQ
jgi:triacylglycerol lipase